MCPQIRIAVSAAIHGQAFSSSSNIHNQTNPKIAPKSYLQLDSFEKLKKEEENNHI